MNLAQYFVSGVSKQSHQPKYNQRLTVDEAEFDPRLTCSKGHPVIFCGKDPKQRVGDDGQPIENTNSLCCDSCGTTFRMSQGYYSCAQSCDFDLCGKCAADLKGNILVKQKGLPSHYTLGGVGCDLCDRNLTQQEIS